MGGAPTRAYGLFCRLQRLGGPGIAHLKFILEEGSPAARLMACWALRQMGEAETAEHHLTELLECDEEVVWRSGCSVSHHPAAELASWLLECPGRSF